ncbi:hypothetical protein RHSP_03418 [Rhizobium freirei PRF 81]|uniref:Uncharacterized protein n=1 Tax=Rhizobium freirei PRF 81 TaxID=363754 RepID=N6U632_9HYPH|nr:hypothetical protein RHSP_03418 [Rhizobium freirei PRF 81]
MATRTSAFASTSSAASDNALSISRSSAFSFSGRETVIVAIWPSTSTLTVPLAMEDTLQNAGVLLCKRKLDVRLGEEVRVHDFQIIRNDEREFGLTEDVFLKIDARRDLRQYDAIRRQLHDAALGNVSNVLALLDSPPAREGDMLHLVDKLLQLAFLLDHELAVVDGELCACIEHAREDDLLRSRCDVDKAASARGHMRTEGQLRHVDRTVPADFQEGKQRGIEAGSLEVGELIRRRHIGVGVRCAAESKIKQRNAADRALFDDPSNGAVEPFLEKNTRHVCGNTEAKIDAASGLELLSHAPGDHLLYVEFGNSEAVERTEDLAGDGGIVEGLRRLLLIGIDDQVVDQHPGYAHIVRLQRTFLGDALDLRDDDAAVVAGSQSLIKAAEIGAFMLIGEIAALVRRGRADDGDLRHDRREEQVVVTFKRHALDHRLSGGQLVHGAALALGIDKGLHADLGQNPRTLCSSLAMHVKHDARGNIIGGNLVIGDHLPDERRLGAGWTGRIGSAEDALQQSLLGDMVHTLDAAHVASGNRMKGGDVAGMAGRFETLADRLQHKVGASQSTG